MSMSARITWNGDHATEEAREAGARGLLLGAEHILGTSNRTVPIEEGTLERSGTASVDEDELVAAVSYDTPYAVRQHEDLSLRHDDGRRAKYLELAMGEELDTVRDILAAQLRRALNS